MLKQKRFGNFFQFNKKRSPINSKNSTENRFEKITIFMFSQNFPQAFPLDRLVTRGVWVRCWTTFLYCGEHRVVKTNRVSVENVLNMKSKISAFLNIQNFWKRLSIEKVTKDLVSDFRIQKSHVTFTMHVPCIPYMGTTWVPMYGIHGKCNVKILNPKVKH